MASVTTCTLPWLGSVVGGQRGHRKTPAIHMAKNKTPLDRSLKRARTEVISQHLLQKNGDNFSRFFVVQGVEEPMQTKSPFAIAKALNQLVGTNYNARKLQNGDVLVEVHTREQSAKIVQLAKIDNTNVTVTTHRSLNLSKGVISESELFHCSDAEIETELRQLIYESGQIVLGHWSGWWNIQGANREGYSNVCSYGYCLQSGLKLQFICWDRLGSDDCHSSSRYK